MARVLREEKSEGHFDENTNDPEYNGEQKRSKKMKIRETMIGNVAVLSMSGQIVSGPDVTPLKSQIQGLVKVR